MLNPVIKSAPGSASSIYHISVLPWLITPASSSSSGCTCTIQVPACIDEFYKKGKVVPNLSKNFFPYKITHMDFTKFLKVFPMQMTIGNNGNFVFYR
jgi:hypothetical protein